MAVLIDEREQVIRDLTRHCGDGRLTLDELEERIEEAYAATTPEELRHALRELPALRAPDPEPVVDVEEDQEEDGARFSFDLTCGRPSRSAPPARHAAASAPAKREQSDVDKAIGALFVIGGFVLLFNGMFWLALLCWFVLPGLVLHNRKG